MVSLSLLLVSDVMIDITTIHAKLIGFAWALDLRHIYVLMFLG